MDINVHGNMCKYQIWVAYLVAWAVMNETHLTAGNGCNDVVVEVHTTSTLMQFVIYCMGDYIVMFAADF